jgi:hypothetical protein
MQKTEYELEQGGNEQTFTQERNGLFSFLIKLDDKDYTIRFNEDYLSDEQLDIYTSEIAEGAKNHLTDLGAEHLSKVIRQTNIAERPRANRIITITREGIFLGMNCDE